MTPLLLVANAGSSSLKFALFKKNEADQPVADATGQVEGIGTQPRFTVKDAAGETLFDRAHDPDEVLHHGGAIAVIRSWVHERDRGATLLAVGHRVVHGQHFSEPVLVDTKVLTKLEALVPLAPLHQPQCLARHPRGARCYADAAADRMKSGLFEFWSDFYCISLSGRTL